MDDRTHGVRIDAMAGVSDQQPRPSRPRLAVLSALTCWLGRRAGAQCDRGRGSGDRDWDGGDLARWTHLVTGEGVEQLDVRATGLVARHDDADALFVERCDASGRGLDQVAGRTDP